MRLAVHRNALASIVGRDNAGRTIVCIGGEGIAALDAGLNWLND
jgi:hypothetical protein